MKQAEILNAIAHNNYMIRQSWKLLVFRYRHLGSYGDLTYPNRPHPIPPAVTQQDDSPNTKLIANFCIANEYWQFMSPNESYCQKSGTDDFNIPLPSVPPTVSGPGGALSFLGLSLFMQGNSAATQAALTHISNACVEKEAFNYYELVNFILAWKRDIANRKQTIIYLANLLSNNSNDFTDLDGNSVVAGARTTLEKNLTYQNNGSNLKVTNFYNSMASAGAGTPTHAPVWLQDIRIYPLFFAFGADDCLAGGKIHYTGYPINVGLPRGPSPLNAPLDQILKMGSDPNFASLGFAQFLASYATPPNNDLVTEPPIDNVGDASLMAASLGYEKNPNFVPYVAYHAESTPQLPFSPFGTITLKATAYAKPFGGTIGPWSSGQWPNGSQISTGTPTSQIDPPRWTGGPPPTAAMVKNGGFGASQYVPDTTRYVGDAAGTKSYLTMTNYAKIFDQFGGNSISLTFWSHLVTDPMNDYVTSPSASSSNGDMLAYPNVASAGPKNYGNMMRHFENAVVAPDNWDVTNYSIDADYYRNYYLRMIAGAANASNPNPITFAIRSDIGQRRLDPSLVNWSIKDQIREAGNFATESPPGLNMLTYFVQDPQELLTSYKSMAPDNPVMDPSTFGKCSAPVPTSAPADMTQATPGNCIVGGRVGYSVKLVDGNYLSNVLGGQIQNPPPSPWP